MTSRDPSASYYDLTLPDGTRTEVWSVLRAVLTEEEALGYVKACILTRIMRDGKKPDVDRLREVEKVGVETGMLREAMAAHLATPDPMVAALDAVDSHDPRECAGRIEDLERELDEARARVAELDSEIVTLKRERDEWRQVADDLDKTVHELTDRYRPRRQSEEPAPEDEPVLYWREHYWLMIDGAGLRPDAIWTNQPPAPEADREGSK